MFDCRKRQSSICQTSELLSGQMTSPEEMERKKKAQINAACNFTIAILAFVVVLEAVDHVYVLKLPGSPL